VLWQRKLSTITREDVLAVLRPIWDKHHVTAQRIRGRLENLFDHAIQDGVYRGDNPARWSLFNATLSAPRKMEGKGHQPALPRAEMPGFIRALRRAQETSVGALALEFAILTASRSGEVRLARWAEIDKSANLWRVPAPRMKMKRPHAVPLTSRMVEILETARNLHLDPLTPDSLIFPGAKAGKPLSDMTLLSTLKRTTNLRATVHGFRSTFRDWAGNQIEHPRELIEEALAHALPAVEAAYRREQAVERRRAIMQDWQDFLDGTAPMAEGGAPALLGSRQEASAC
jgi:integrase